MNSDDTQLVQELSNSFRSQISKYSELKALVQKMMGKLILSRGDLTGLMGALEQKKQLLESIENERQLHTDAIVLWQKRKVTIEASPEVSELDEIFSKTGSAIKEFMDEEEQLQSYLEGLMKKSGS